MSSDIRRLPPGDCHVCGNGPLHGPRFEGLGSGCGCSFERDGLRLCRACAFVVDTLEHGASRISDPGGVELDFKEMGKRYRRWVLLSRDERS